MPIKITSSFSSLASIASPSTVLYFLGSFNSFEGMLEWM